MRWRIQWLANHRIASAVVAVVTISSIFTVYTVYDLGLVGTLLVCPGCSPPPQIAFLDHYTIQNNTNQQPCLLTIWFRSSGPVGKSLTVLALTLKNGQTVYDFTINDVTIPALTIVPVSVDTSSQGLFFQAGQRYSIGLITKESTFGLGTSIAYPPETLAQQGYTIGSDQGQTNATVLNVTLINLSAAPATLASLTIQDTSSGSSAFTFQMNGPTITEPGNWTLVTLDTRGSGFYFTRQHIYTLTVTPTAGPPSSSLIFFQ
jgi:hypothetical protein